MLSINTNLSSLIAQQSMSSATNKLNQAIERMTTGYKINGAKDNAANYSISTNMTTKINSYMVAEDNVAMGLDMLSTANGSLDQISDKLTRLRALATQASNGTYGTQSLTAINSEANALVDEIERLYNTAEYNSKSIFVDNTTYREGVNYSKTDIENMTSITEAYNAGSFTAGETYSISTVDELCKFRDMVNAGNHGAGVNFVLANDLDLSSISNWVPIGESDVLCFRGSFDGNGNVISNLKIDSTKYNTGLFGFVYLQAGDVATIQNIGLENVKIKSTSDVVGALVGLVSNYGASLTIANNYVTNSVVSGANAVGGLIGILHAVEPIVFKNNYAKTEVQATDTMAGGLVGHIVALKNIDMLNNYADCNITGSSCVGGFAGYIRGNIINVKNNYALGEVNGDDLVGGFTGAIDAWSGALNFVFESNYTNCNVVGETNQGGFVGGADISEITFTNCASVYSDNFVTQMSFNEIEKKYDPVSMGFTETNGWAVVNGIPVLSWQKESNTNNKIELQVGINSDDNSIITTDTGFSLLGIDRLRKIGLSEQDFTSKIDMYINLVVEKLTSLGSSQNRLESALDEIAIQYDNLVSSRSTLRDADIAEVSSQYIQQQILQQASATLLATANQSPSIALQLI